MISANGSYTSKKDREINQQQLNDITWNIIKRKIHRQ